MILDVSLPDGAGYDPYQKICRTSKVPIILPTAADEETDMIMGLDMGGDDSSNGLFVQLLTHEVYKDGIRIDLTATEYKPLCFFIENPNIVLSPEQILRQLWDREENYNGIPG